MLAGDTAVRSQNVFRPEQVELAGGGGTDMSALIVAAAEERPAPKAILVATDGYTGWPREPVAPRVVACLTKAWTADAYPSGLIPWSCTQWTKLAAFAKRRPAG